MRSASIPLGEAAAQWASVRWIEVDGSPIRYRDAGSGPALVLVHGLGVSADYWVRTAPIVAAAGFRVLAPDLPGFGRSGGPDGGLDVPAQASAVRRWARALGLGPAAYLGHSLSCQVALQFAADSPEAVTGLILAGPTGDGTAVRRLVRQAVGLARDVPREPVKLAILVAQAYFRAGPLKVIRTWRMGAFHDPIALLPRISAPGIVVVGDRDPVVDLDFAEKLAGGLPGGRVVVIPEAAHAVIFDSSGRFNETVVSFLEGLGTQ